MPTDYKRVLLAREAAAQADAADAGEPGAIGTGTGYGQTTGFMEFPRNAAPYRDAAVRLLDFQEIYTEHDEARLPPGRALHGLWRAVLPVG
jgi:hypothetical protein